MCFAVMGDVETDFGPAQYLAFLAVDGTLFIFSNKQFSKNHCLMDASWDHVGRTHLSALLRAEREIAARAMASVVLVDDGVAGQTERLRSSSRARHHRLFAED